MSGDGVTDLIVGEQRDEHGTNDAWDEERRCVKDRRDGSKDR